MISRAASPGPRTAFVAAFGTVVALLATAPARLVAQHPPAAPPPHAHAGPTAARDSSFASLQRRGKTVMGVDQYRSAHRFDDLPDGGWIELQSTANDSSAARTIREHLATVARAFAAGDFSAPALVHDKRDPRAVPGAATMAARRAAIRYQVKPLPRGAALRISTRDPEALRAVHEFLAFQRADHRAAGHGAGR